VARILIYEEVDRIAKAAYEARWPKTATGFMPWEKLPDSNRQFGQILVRDIHEDSDKAWADYLATGQEPEDEARLTFECAQDALLDFLLSPTLEQQNVSESVVESVVSVRPPPLDDVKVQRAASAGHTAMERMDGAIGDFGSMGLDYQAMCRQAARAVSVGHWTHVRRILDGGDSLMRALIDGIIASLGVTPPPGWDYMAPQSRPYRIRTTGKLLVELVATTQEDRSDYLRALLDRWEACGAPAYVITSQLAQVLAATSIEEGEVPWAEVPLPAETFYLEFEGPVLDGNWPSGYLVYAMLVKAPSSQPYPEISLIGYGPDGSLMTMHPSDDHRVVHYLPPTLINVCLYLAHRPGSVHAVPNHQEPLLEVSARRKGKKKRKAEALAARMSRYDRYVVDIDQRDRMVLREGKGSGSCSGVRFHRVKGFWRTLDPEKNPRWTEYRRLLVPPHYRGDPALGVVEKVYSDDPRRAAAVMVSRTRAAEIG